MNIKKTLEFATKVDNSGFDSAVKDMQRQLKELTRPADIAAAQQVTNQKMQSMGLGGNLSKSATEAFKKSINQTKVEMDKFIVDQAKGLESAAKLIAKEEAALKQLRATQQGLNKDTKEYMEYQEKIANQESNIRKQREQVAGKYEGLNEAINTRRKMDEPDCNGGGNKGGGNKGGGNYNDMLSGGAKRELGSLAIIAATAAAAIRGTENLAGSNLRLQQTRGSAIENTVGTDLSRVYAGKSAFEQGFMPERQAAEGEAEEKKGWNRTTDALKSGLGMAAGIGGGALSGLTVGGIPGAVIGAGVGGYTAYSNMDDRTRHSLFGGKAYEQDLANTKSEDFRSAYEAFKKQNPQKTENLERFEGNYQQELDQQRRLGLSDNDLRGELGFQARVHGAGFLTEQGNQMEQQIMSAGGSARMGKNAEFGLQMQRAGLTNAGGILGSLSGSIQSAETSKQATIGIMAEAFQQGLDNTNFAEENRRFTQAAAGIIGKSGATTVADQDKLSNMLGQFLGQRTNQGVEAATSAYEAYQQRGSTTTGRRGVMRFQAAQNDKFLGKLSTQDQNTLLGAEPGSLRETDPMLIAMAKKTGIPGATAKDLINSLDKGNADTRFVNYPGRQKQSQKLDKTINDYLSSHNMTRQEFTEKAERGGKELPSGADTDAAINAFGTLKAFTQQETAAKYNSSTIAAQTQEGMNGFTPKTLSEQKAAQEASLLKKDGRLGDEVNAAGAAGQDKGREALNGMTDDIRKMATAADTFTQAITKSATALGVIATSNLSTQKQSTGLNIDIPGIMSGNMLPSPQPTGNSGDNR